LYIQAFKMSNESRKKIRKDLTEEGSGESREELRQGRIHLWHKRKIQIT
jgi:hypothetical protein